MSLKGRFKTKHRGNLNKLIKLNYLQGTISHFFLKMGGD